MELGTSDPQLIVIYGGAGDLARTKLLPALYQLLSGVDSQDRAAILAVGRSDRSDHDYRAMAALSLRDAGVDSAEAEA